jgi:hypothetical protein
MEDDDTFETMAPGIGKAIERASQAYLGDGRTRPLTVHDRANEAKVDYLVDALPGGLYQIMKGDIARVWDLLESPIEQVAIFQLAAENYSLKEGWPIYAKVARERGMFSHKHYPVQIIPQVAFGPYRVDFLFDLGGRGLVAIECDGEDYHQDKERDKARDEHLKVHFGVTVLRSPGKRLWRDNSLTTFYADVIRAKLL